MSSRNPASSGSSRPAAAGGAHPTRGEQEEEEAAAAREAQVEREQAFRRAYHHATTAAFSFVLDLVSQRLPYEELARRLADNEERVRRWREEGDPTTMEPPPSFH